MATENHAVFIMSQEQEICKVKEQMSIKRVSSVAGSKKAAVKQKQKNSCKLQASSCKRKHFVVVKAAVGCQVSAVSKSIKQLSAVRYQLSAKA